MTASGRLLDRLWFVLAVLAAWQLGAWVAGSEVLPAPARTASRIVALLADPDFSGDVAETARAFLLALGIALAGGVGLGVLFGANRLAGEVAEPLLVSLYAIPKVTLYPLILLLCGLGLSAKVTFGTIHGIVPVVLITMTAVRNIRPVQRRVARSLGMGPWRTALDILVPATLPDLVTAARLGFALTLLGTLIGEMFASQRGIGHLLIQAMETNEADTIMALAVLLSIVATTASMGLLAIERRLQARTA